jgi:predicted nucleotide-binding protein
MTENKPSVFIGSSSEGLDVAREVELQLQRDAITTIWKDGVFGLGSGTLESLMKVLEQFDFAVMVLSPDDLTESRSQSYTSPRDNVIFELGLFMGRLGRSRVFIVHQQDESLKLPSDLAGIAVSPYQKRDNLSAALFANLYADH